MRALGRGIENIGFPNERENTGWVFLKPWNRKNIKEMEADSFFSGEGRGRNALPSPEEESGGVSITWRASSNPPALDVLPIPWLQEVNPYFPSHSESREYFSRVREFLKDSFLLPRLSL